MGENFNPKEITFTANIIENKEIEDKEMVEHPSHYNAGEYEPIDVINDWKLNFNLGNTIKYIARHEHKGKPLEDLKKAMFYLKYEVERLEDK